MWIVLTLEPSATCFCTSASCPLWSCKSPQKNAPYNSSPDNVLFYHERNPLLDCVHTGQSHIQGTYVIYIGYYHQNVSASISLCKDYVVSLHSYITNIFLQISPWLVSIGFSLCFGTIMAKMGRVFYIFNNPTLQKKYVSTYLIWCICYKACVLQLPYVSHTSELLVKLCNYFEWCCSMETSSVTLPHFH